MPGLTAKTDNRSKGSMQLASRYDVVDIKDKSLDTS